MVWYSTPYIYGEQEDAIQYHENTFRCVTGIVMQNVQELTVTISSNVLQKSAADSRK